MRGSTVHLVALCLALACGGPRSVSTDSGTSSGTGSEGTSESEASTNAEVDTTAEGEAEGPESSTSDEAGDTGSQEACVIALALDTCCSQPLAVSSDDLESEACLVPWPVDWSALNPELLESCVAMQPEFCEVVDCDYVEPPSEEVYLDEAGECAWSCPKGESIGYLEPGCEDPPPIASCLPPPPPCIMDYCSCEGETITGCGMTGEPHAHVGPCE